MYIDGVIRRKVERYNNAIIKIEELKHLAETNGEIKSVEDGKWDDEERGKWLSYNEVLKLLKGE
jgi:hypothetical protein